MSPETGFAFLAAFAIVLALGPAVIRRLAALKFGQNINTDVPEHAKKQGTPTMGGVLIIVGVFVGVFAAVIAQATFHKTDMASAGILGLGAPLFAVLLVFLAHGALGFTDDYLSIKRGKSLGLKARWKLLGQFIIAGLFVIWLWLNARSGFTTVVIIGHPIDFGVSYYFLAVLVIMGISNATNLTDGLDGLLGGTSIFAAIGLAITVFPIGVSAHLSWFGFAVAGACLGFLWYNAHPAKVFMGDTGSLAIGGGFAAMAIAGKQEILLFLFSLIFLLEMGSVMIQVSVFKGTRLYRRQFLKQANAEGHRIFTKTPIHHGFQVMGVPETVVVARFWIVGVLAMVAGLMLAPYFSTFLVGQ